MNIATSNSSASLQLDIFNWASSLINSRVKKVMCLDCDRVQLTLKFNEEKNIYEGRRLCKSCRQLQKRKYLSNW